jgi:hypothetical protein
MTVTLIVEDGTGMSNANAIISLDEFKAYCDERKLSYSAYADDDLNAAIVRASAFFANAYVYQGQKVNRRAQTMPYPRYATSDKEGWPVLPTEIPQELKDACAEVTLREAADPGSMNPDVVMADKIRALKAGSVSIDYANVQTSPIASRPTLLIVNDLIWPFLMEGAGNMVVGKSYRG